MPRSHVGVVGHRGFVKPRKENPPVLGPAYQSCSPALGPMRSLPGRFAKLTKEEAAAAAAQRQKLLVPPGHMLIFNEKLMHEVVGHAPPTPTHTILCVRVRARLRLGLGLGPGSEAQAQRVKG